MKTHREKSKPRAMRIVIFGIHGSAKTTLASKLRNAVFLDYENGTHGIEVTKADDGELPKNYTDAKALFSELKRDHQGFESLVIDTGDKFEQQLDRSYSTEKGIESIFSTNDYGRTVSGHNAQFASILDAANEMVASGMNLVWICHETPRKIEPTEGAKIPHDHSELKMSKGVSKLIMQEADWVIFCARKTFHAEGDKKSGEKDHLEGGKLWTWHSPTLDFDAKHRAFVEVPEDDMSMDKLQSIIQSIVDKSIDVNAKSQFIEGSMAVKWGDPTKVEGYDPDKATKEAAKKSDPENKPEADKKPETENVERKNDEETNSDLPEAAKKLVKLIGQFEVSEEKLRDYAAGKLNDRYGVDFKTLPMNDWPEDALNWLNRGMDKIAPKIK